MKKNIVQEKSFSFALKVVRLVDGRNDRKYDPIINQLLRSGTSIGANIEEALGAQSKKDFIGKVNIAYKEAREVKYWLRLLIYSRNVSKEKLKVLLQDADELCKILWSIINTSRSNC